LVIQIPSRLFLKKSRSSLRFLVCLCRKTD